MAPNRLSVIGLGEWRPAKPNDTADDRNANRRVLLVILSGTADTTDGSAADGNARHQLARSRRRSAPSRANPPRPRRPPPRPDIRGGGFAARL